MRLESWKTLRILCADLPFTLISSIEVPPFGRRDTITPAIDLGPIKDQRDDSFIATVGKEQMQISLAYSNWTITDRATVEHEDENDLVKSCFVLTNSTKLVVMRNKLRFYSSRLQHIHSVSPGEIVTGLKYV